MIFLFACAPTDDSKAPVDSGDSATDTDSTVPDTTVALLPAPVVFTPGDGALALDSTTTLGATGDAVPVADALAATLRASTGLPFPVGATGTLQLTLGADTPPEGYLLDVTPTGATLQAADTDGLFWATQTLLQLAPPQVYAASVTPGVDWSLPAAHIEDAPRFAWRGLMIDVARHFFPIADLERQIDVMAAHKLNRLHLHLTDDQGWRVEIASWPALTTIGGSTEVGGGPGGFYTQAELRGLIDYAAARHVTVIPEVDFPGHANAAVASYPELNESGEAAALYTGTGVISTPLWLEGPDTLRFVSDVWAEVAALSPDTVVHLGGDEAVDINAADYATFLMWLQADLEGEGRTIIGWDEVGPVGLDAPFTAQYWYDADNTREAVANGGQVIASPAGHAYLDMMQSPGADYGQVWAGLIDTETAFDWDPVLSGLDEADVLGVEGCLWTEFIDDQEKMDFMLWPRAAALAEVGWGTTSDWRAFKRRLGAHGARLDALGVGYYADPEVSWAE